MSRSLADLCARASVTPEDYDVADLLHDASIALKAAEMLATACQLVMSRYVCQDAIARVNGDGDTHAERVAECAGNAIETFWSIAELPAVTAGGGE